LHRAATAHAHIDIVRGGNSNGATRQLGGELTCLERAIVLILSFDSIFQRKNNIFLF
jgi:hypothetical protein